MGKFSPAKRNGDCEEIANTSTAFGRRRRNWIDAHGSVPAGQVVDASCGNKRCIALKHAYLRPKVEQPGTYRKLADRVHRLRVGQLLDDHDLAGLCRREHDELFQSDGGTLRAEFLGRRSGVSRGRCLHPWAR